VTLPVPRFQTGSSIAYANSNGQILADVNGDQVLDVIGDSNTDITVTLGKPNGSFQSPQLFFTPCSLAGKILPGDFNGDGLLDLIVACGNQNNGGYTVLLGDGKGNFEAGPLFNDPNVIFTTLVAADFNRDGKLDFAATDDVNVYVFLNNGDGTFTSTAVSSVAGPFQVGDFNGDGLLDLVVAVPNTPHPELDTFLGNGDGTFNFYSFVGIDGNSQLFVADLNHDGKLDVVTLDSQNLVVVLGNGDGTFQAQKDYPAPQGSQTPVSGDLNGDGNLDFIAGNAQSNDLAIFLGNSDGTFRPAATIPVGKDPIAVAAGDFNNDGRLDLIYSLVTNGGIFILPQATVIVSPTAPRFDVQTLNTTSPAQKVVLGNIGNKPLTISNIAIFGDFAQTNTCLQNGGKLGVGKTCTITVTFTPTGIDERTGTLTVTDDAFTSPQQVSLVGTGTVTSFSPTQLVFPDTPVGSQSDPESVTLTNVGSVPLLIGGIHIRGGNLADFYISSNTCGKGIPAGGQCTVSVFFKPLAKGKRTSNLNFTDNGGASPQSVPLGGKGT